ncbi:hypothetical protein [Natrinema sp. 74]|uniref:hypothetical protein n=1 Tax=Natrinema sp. 74 TaxID=3384159 RepID=UPI0038D3E02E
MVQENSRNSELEEDSVSRRDYLRAGLVTTGIAVSPAVLTEGMRTARAASNPLSDPAPVDSAIGGGEQYGRKVSKGDYTVSTKDQLVDKLSSADSGETVYIPNDVAIDLGKERNIHINSGVTLASGRGINGAPGGRLYTDHINTNSESGTPVFEIRGDNVRITGLRMQGPRADYFNPGKCEGQTGLQCRDDEAMGTHATRGFLIMGSEVEVDNCQMYGWPWVPIMTGAYDGYAVNTHIHHNSLHNNQMEGYGYGVRVTVGNPTIEWNYFDRNRHSIAASGSPGCSYEARYNLVGPHTVSHAFDMHGEETGDVTGGKRAGDEMHIHHNTFQFEESYVYKTGQEGVTVRGVPDEQAILENNWFYHDLPDGQNKPDSTNTSENGQPFRQYKTPQDNWMNLTFTNNHYGRDEPASDIGHPRSGDGGDRGSGGDGSLTAEIGTVSQDSDMWQSVSFDESFADPIVVMKPVAQFNGENPSHTRIRNVTSSGFEYMIEEWEYTADGHRPETISYLAMEKGTGVTSDGNNLEVGTTTADESFSTLTFESNFNQAPIVFTQTQSVNGSDPVVTRNAHVNTEDFIVRLQETGNKSHRGEVTAYIAIEPGVTTLGGGEVEIGRKSGVTDGWERLEFNGSYSSPEFVADMQTTNSGDVATLRYRDPDTSGVDIEVEEEQSNDSESDHPGETVGYLVTTTEGSGGAGG